MLSTNAEPKVNWVPNLMPTETHHGQMVNQRCEKFRDYVRLEAGEKTFLLKREAYPDGFFEVNTSATIARVSSTY